MAPRSPDDMAAPPKDMYFGKYVSQVGSKNLKLYTYKGTDHSLIYKHVLTPMNNYLIQFIPLWLAPNTITLLGLIAVTVSHGIVASHCPNLEGDAPTWVYVFSAVALFFYQTLDNLDGKQARRTGTSSPLGLLFDHGCDAINCTVGSMTMSAVAQFGVGWKSVLMVLWINFAFIGATWEEYYTGSLELPIINGPTEGVLIGVTLKLVTAALGTGFWREETFVDGIQNNTLFLFLMLATSSITVLGNIYNVAQTVSKQKSSLVVAMTRLIPFALFNGLAIFWALHSPSNVLSVHPRMFLWTTGLLNSKLLLHLMLAHLCEEEFHPFRKTLVPLFYVAGHYIFCHVQGMLVVGQEVESLLVQEFFYISLASYVHIVFTVIMEVKTVLNIPVFTVPAEKQKAR
ncbi:hypothetical protein H310_00739 [Aphanomyces invadans]|uniref:CDP-alcohol phosphatidyltransferase n=1 Tax=Aphanomyces invadans TaxID=157072 RepID=A0A024UVT8_9STRA|nr:hypothetical protein H310_00739 [Aphanomyces invadans]ETW10434.1 hypothetical protein H310_00739 [Aphanomyces invadans]|eukprot:XP_008861845.1 hypothetical protein H310_00739 [Aphanomyces invadans]